MMSFTSTKDEVLSFSKKNPMYVILLIMIIAMSMGVKNFLTFGNLLNVLIAESTRGILALGVGVVIITKGIDLSVGSIVALSSVLSASLVQDPNYVAKLLPGIGVLPAWVAFIVGLMAGVLIGAFSGYLVAYKKVPPFVATLGTQVIARGLSYVYTNAYPVSNLSNEFRILGQGKIGGISYLVILLAVLCFVTGIILHKTAFGKTLYAIGGNENSARIAGVRVEKNTMLAYTFSGALAGLVGIMLASRSGAGSASLGTGYELDAIAAATIGGVSQSGGVGAIGGIIVGIFILGFMNNGLLLLGVSPYIQQILKGVIIILAVIIDSAEQSKKFR